MSTLPINVPPATGLGGFGILQAIDATDRVADLVEDRLDDAVDNADRLRGAALDALNTLSTLDYQLTVPPLPTPTQVGGGVALTSSGIQPPSDRSVGDVVFDRPTKPTLSPVRDIPNVPFPTIADTALDIPGETPAPVLYEPGDTAVNPPTMIDLDEFTFNQQDKPDAPDLDPVPTVALPELPALDPNVYAYKPPRQVTRPDINTSVGIDDTAFPEYNPADYALSPYQEPNAPELNEVDADISVIIPDFSPSITAFNIPEPPALASLGEFPDIPVLPTSEIPNAPPLVRPDLPALVEITIPDFDVTGLEEIVPDLAALDASPVDAVLAWDEPVYATEILDEVLAKVRELWEGGLGVPPHIEHAMWERATEREDLQTARDIASATTDFASRGHTFPPGALLFRVDQIREDRARATRGVNRDLTVEVAKIHVDNVRFATEQAIAAENVLFNIHNNTAQRMFEAEKARVELKISAHNMLVGIYNANVSRYSAQVQALATRQNLKVDVFKARLQAALAVGDLNQQRVQLYASQIQALNAETGLYEAQVRGAVAKLDAARNLVEIYKAEVQGYAERVNAAKLPFDVYKTRVEAETAKTGIIDAEARSYAALVSGRTAAADVAVKAKGLTLENNRQRVASFQLKLDQERNMLAHELGAIQTAAEGFRTAVSISSAKADVAVKEAELTMAGSRLQLDQYQTDIQAATSEAQIQADASRTAAQVYQIAVTAETSKAEIAARLAELTISRNKLKVDLYQALIDAAATDSKAQTDVLQAKVAAFKAYDEGVVSRAEIAQRDEQTAVAVNESRVRLYMAELERQSAWVDQQLKGFQAQSDNFRAKVQAASVESEINIKRSEHDLATNEGLLRQYAAELDAEKTAVQAQATAVGARTDAFRADVERFNAEARREASFNELNVTIAQGQERVLVADYEARVKAFEVQMRIITERTAQLVESMRSIGSMTSTLAAGAMAGINVGASMSGGAQIAGSGSSSYNETLGFQQSVSENIEE